MAELVFVDRLPPDVAPRSYTRWRTIAEALRRQPRRWALVRDDCPTRKAAMAVTYQIRDGKTAPFRPAGEFEARAITAESGVHQVWVRYIGGAA